MTSACLSSDRKDHERVSPSSDLSIQVLRSLARLPRIDQLSRRPCEIADRNLVTDRRHGGQLQRRLTVDEARSLAWCSRTNSRLRSSSSAIRSGGNRSTATPARRSWRIPFPVIVWFGSSIPIATRETLHSIRRAAQDTFGCFLRFWIFRQCSDRKWVRATENS